ncbi:MAG: TatD family hydrolase [Puniceicoccales bacterium]|jgi:TatD DNase family protein|nr:TatD family hydrolase [Puniceicoccales bacterium]
MLMDAHCHLDVFAERGTLADVLAEARRNSVTAYVATGTNPEDWVLYQNLAQTHGDIFYTLGLHPLNVGPNYVADLEVLEKMITAQKPVAVGEIGLDFHRIPEESPQGQRQKAAFEAQLQIARAVDLPVVIHCRDAFSAVYSTLKRTQFDGEKVLFHCFTGGLEETQILKEWGSYASFSGIVTYKNAEKVRQALAHFERILIETDCPFLAPIPHRGKENQPAFLRCTAEAIAPMRGQSTTKIASQTWTNTRRFFGLTL